MQNLLNQDSRADDLFIYDQQLAYDQNWAVQSLILRRDPTRLYNNNQSGSYHQFNQQSYGQGGWADQHEDSVSADGDTHDYGRDRRERQEASRRFGGNSAQRGGTGAGQYSELFSRRSSPQRRRNSSVFVESTLLTDQQTAGNQESVGDKQAAKNGHNNQGGTTLDNQLYDQLQQIVNLEDPRLERLRIDNTRQWELNVNQLSQSMNFGLDNFYIMSGHFQQELALSQHLHCDLNGPTLTNLPPCTQELMNIALAPWQFGSLPGVFAKTARLLQEPSLLESLAERLKQMKPLDLWCEPVDFMPQPSESFFQTLHELLVTLAEQSNTNSSAQTDENVAIQSNAVISLYGLAILSGSYELIVTALDTIREFERKSSASNATKVFEKSQEALTAFLAHISDTFNQKRSVHRYNSEFECGIFGVSKHSFKVNQPNSHQQAASMTTDGMYVYIIETVERHAQLIKIGNGLMGTVAGKTYAFQVHSNEKAAAFQANGQSTAQNGIPSWVYCKGFLYLRYGSFKTIHVLDAADFKEVGSVQLDMSSLIADTNHGKHLNAMYPLLTDGQDIYTVVYTVEQRQRKLKEEYEGKLSELEKVKKEVRKEILKDLKKAEESSQADKEKAPPKRPAKKKKCAVKNESQIEKDSNVSQNSPPIKEEKTEDNAIDSDPLLQEQLEPYFGQTYQVCVFHALKFDIQKAKDFVPETKSVKKEGKKEKSSKSKSADKEEKNENSALVLEMWQTFGCLYSQAQCALALSENKNDIHDAGQWLIDEKDKKMEQKEESLEKPKSSPKNSLLTEQQVASQKGQQKERKPSKIVPMVEDYVFCESILKTQWNGKNPSWRPECIKESLVQPSQILPGLLTIKDDQIQVISDYQSEKTQIRVFSLNSEKQEKNSKYQQNYELKPDTGAGKQLETHMREFVGQHGDKIQLNEKQGQADSLNLFCFSEKKDQELDLENQSRDAANLDQEVVRQPRGSQKISSDVMNRYRETFNNYAENYSSEDQGAEMTVSEDIIPQILEDLNLLKDDVIMRDAFNNLQLADQDKVTFTEFSTLCIEIDSKNCQKTVKEKLSQIDLTNLKAQFDKQKKPGKDQIAGGQVVQIVNSVMGQPDLIKDLRQRMMKVDVQRTRMFDFDQLCQILDKPNENTRLRQNLNIAMQNQRFFWDGDQWLKYTNQQVNEGIHLATFQSKLEPIEKVDKEAAKKMQLVSEWDTYGNLTYQSKLIHISEDHNLTINPVTHIFCVDHRNAKIIHMDWQKKSRIFLAHDPYGFSKMAQANGKSKLNQNEQSQQQMLQQKQLNKVESFSKLIVNTLDMTQTANCKRFSLDWRWSQWKETYSKALNAINYGQNRMNLQLNPCVEKEKNSDESADKTHIKRLQKRLQQIEQREISFELARSGIVPITATERAQQRLSKTQNQSFLQQSKNSKKSGKAIGNASSSNRQNVNAAQTAVPVLTRSSESPWGFGKFNEKKAPQRPPNTPQKHYNQREVDQKISSKIDLPQHVLPHENIQIAVENRKLYTFCVNGSAKTIQRLFNMIQDDKMEQIPLYQALVDAFATAEHLLGHYNSELMDEICLYLQQKVDQISINSEITQNIWRILVIGWYKFARNLQQQQKLLKFFLQHSDQSLKNQCSETYIQILPQMDLLINTAHVLTPMQLFNIRFFIFPRTFYFLDLFRVSQIKTGIIRLKTESLDNPILIKTAKKSKKDETLSEVYSRKQRQLTSQPSSSITNAFNSRYDSTSAPIEQSKGKEEQKEDEKKEIEEQEEPFVVPLTRQVTNMSRVVLIPKSEHIFDSPKVDVSLSMAPTESIFIDFYKEAAGHEQIETKNETYFAMPLAQILNPIMIKYDAPEPQWNHLKFLCNRFSSSKFQSSPEATPQESKKAHYDFLMNLQSQASKERRQIQDLFRTKIAELLKREDTDENVIQHIKSYSLSYRNLISNSCQMLLGIESSEQLPYFEDLVKQLRADLEKLDQNSSDQKLSETTVVQLQELIELLNMLLHQLQGLLYSRHIYMLTNSIVDDLLAIFCKIRSLFVQKWQTSSTQKENGQNIDDFKKDEEKQKEEVCDYMDQLCFMSMMGEDSLQTKVLQSAHPMPQNTVYQDGQSIQVDKAIGFTVYIDPQSDVLQSCSISLKTKRQTMDLQPPFAGQIVLLTGSSLAVGISVPAMQKENMWGVKITCTPILHTPNYKFKHQKTMHVHKQIQQQYPKMERLLQTMGHLSHVIRSMGHQMSEKCIIEAQTDAQLGIGDGILRNFGKLESDLDIIFDQDRALNYTISKEQSNKSSDSKKSNKQIREQERKMGSELTNWWLFKGGLSQNCLKERTLNEFIEESFRLLQYSESKLQNQFLKKFYEVENNPSISKKLAESSALKDQHKQSVNIQSSTIDTNNQMWSTEAHSLLSKATLTDKSKAESLLEKIRSCLVSETTGYKQMMLMPAARKHSKDWIRVQVSLLVAILLHTNAIINADKFLEISTTDCKQLKTDFENSGRKLIAVNENSLIVVQFYAVGQAINDLLLWMGNRLKGQKVFNSAIQDAFTIVESEIENAKKMHAERVAEIQAMELEDKRSALLREEANKEKEKKKAEQMAKEQQEKEVQDKKKSSVKITKSSNGGAISRRAGRGNISRIAPIKPLPKPQLKKKQSAQQDEVGKSNASELSQKGKLTDSESKVSAQQIATIESKKVEFTNAEIDQMIVQILKKTEENFKKYFQDKDNAKFLLDLCNFFDLSVNSDQEDQIIAELFVKVKTRLGDFINFKSPKDLVQEDLSLSSVNLPSPYEEIVKDVDSRIKFLFEISPSFDFIQNVSNPFKSKDDLEEVERFLGVQKASLALEKSQSTQKETSSKDTEAKFAKDFSSNCRKWLNWFSSLNSDKTSQDLTSSQCSPITAVLQFAQQTKVQDVTFLRNHMLDQLYTAIYVLKGVLIQKDMNQVLGTSAFNRFSQGLVTYFFDDSQFSGIETCGQKLNRILNHLASNKIKNLILDSIQYNQNSKISEQILHKRQSQSTESSSKDNSPEQLNQAEQKQDLKIEKSPENEKQDIRVQRMTSKAEEIQYLEDLRLMLFSLTDINIYLNDDGTKSYFLNVLNSQKSLSSNDSSCLGEKELRQFFILLVQNSLTFSVQLKNGTVQKNSAISLVYKSLVDISRVIVSKLTSKNFMLSDLNKNGQSFNLQLLEILIEELEEAFRIFDENQKIKQNENKSTIKDSQDKEVSSELFIALMKQISEILTGQLTESDLKSPCIKKAATLLSHIVLQANMPQVVRLASQTASQIFRYVDVDKVFLKKNRDDDQTQQNFLQSLLKKVGAKIANTEEHILDNIEAKKDEQSLQSSKDDEKVQKEIQQDEKSVDQEYYVYSNLNIPDSEDYLFLVTAIWHWYQKNPHPNLRLVMDPNEIEEEAKSSDDESNTNADEKKKEDEGPKKESGEKSKEKKSDEGDVMMVPDAVAAQEEENKAALKDQSPDEKAKLEKEKVSKLAQQRQELIEAHSKEQFNKFLQTFESNFSTQEDLIAHMKQATKAAAILARDKELGTKKFLSTGFGPRPVEIMENELMQDEELRNKYNLSLKDDPYSQQVPAKIEDLRNILRKLIQDSFKKPTSKDSDEIRQQKVKEHNYNTLLQFVLDEACKIASLMKHRCTTAILGPCSLEKAHRFSSMLNNAYNGGLPAIQINPFMDKESFGKTFEKKQPEEAKKAKKPQKPAAVKEVNPLDLFPLKVSSMNKLGKKNELSFFKPIKMFIRPKDLVITICTRQNALMLEKALLERQIGLQKYQIQNPNDPRQNRHRSGEQGIVKQPDIGGVVESISQNVRLGSSSQIVIQELIQLVWKIVGLKNQDCSEKISGSTKLQQAQLSKRTLSSKRGTDETSQLSSVEISLIEQIDLLSKDLIEKKWDSEISRDQKLGVIGTLAVIGAWKPSISIGQQIQVGQKGSNREAKVIDDGKGRGKVQVIFEDAPDLQIQEVSQAEVQPIFSNLPTYNGPFGNKIDRKLLFKAITSVLRQTQESMSQKQTQSLNLEDIVDAQSVKGDRTENELLSSNLLLQLLLKIGSKLLYYEQDMDSEYMREFQKTLIQIQQSCQDEGSSIQAQKLSLERDWLALVDAQIPQSRQFYAPREFIQSADKSGEELSHQNAMNDLILNDLKRQSTVATDQTSYNDVEYFQQKNYFLQGLPQPQTGIANEQLEAKIRKSKFFEDVIYPRAAVIMSNDAYRGMHEMINYAVESIRFTMKNDYNKGMDELKHTTKGSQINLPDRSYDWRVKIIDEVPVDQWFVAQLSAPNNSSQNGQNQPQITHESQSKLGSKSSQKSATTTQQSSKSLIERLVRLGITQVLVQVKAVDVSKLSVLAEYYEADTETLYWLWVPLAHIKTASTQIQPKPCSFLRSTLADNFTTTLKHLNVFYARQTLLQMYQLANKGNLSNLKNEMQNIVSWGIQDKFAENPLTGFLEDAGSVIMTYKAKNSLQQKLQESKQSDPQALVAEIFDKTVENFNLQKIQEDITFEEGQEKENILAQFQGLLSEFAQQIESEEADQKSSLQNLVSWCVSMWQRIQEQIKNETAVIDICKEIRKNEGSAIGNKICLHEFLPSKGKNTICTVLSFKRDSCRMTAGSKLKFYSDDKEITLVDQIEAQEDRRTEYAPMVINEASIWVSYEQSNNALLQEDQIVSKPEFTCAIFQLPSEWTVACWLTEAIASSLTSNQFANGATKSLTILRDLTQALTNIYEKSNLPGLLSQIVLKIIQRLVAKTRYIYQELVSVKKAFPTINNLSEESSDMDRVFIKSDFVSRVSKSIKEHIQCGEDNSQDLKKDQILHNAFVQDAIEFIMTISVPLNQQLEVKSHDQFLSSGGFDKSDQPKILDSILQLNSLINFFRGDCHLNMGVLNQIMDSGINYHKKYHLDNLVVIRKIPSKDRLYSREWILSRILAILKLHQVRILDPQKDIWIAPDEDQPDQYHQIVIVIDGFSHKRPADDLALKKEDEKAAGDSSDDESSQVKLPSLHIDTDDEQPDGEDNAQKEEQKEEPAGEEEKPPMFTCTACPMQFENDIENESCLACEAPRPPMDELIKKYKAEKMANQEPDEVDEAAGTLTGQNEGTPLHRERLMALKADLRHIVSHEQRDLLLKRVEEDKRKKEEAEAKQKAEEAKLQAEEAEKDKEVKETSEKKSSDNKDSDKKDSDKKDSDKKDSDKKDSDKKEEKQENSESKPKAESQKQEDKSEEQKDQAADIQEKKKDGSDSETDSDAEQEEEKLPDLDNLPEDKFEKLKILGVEDEDIEDARIDDQMYQIFEMSAMEVIQQKIKDRDVRIAERKKKKEAKALAKKEAAMKKAMEEAGGENKVEIVKFDVFVTTDETFDGTTEARRSVESMLRDRFSQKIALGKTFEENSSAKQDEEFKLCTAAQEFIKQLGKAYKESPERAWVEDSENILEDFGITRDLFVNEKTQESEILEKIQQLADLNSTHFARLLVSHGYDMWLQKAVIATQKPKFEGLKDFNLRNIDILKGIRQLVETDYCHDSTIVNSIQQTDIRLLSMLKGKSEVQNLSDLLASKEKAPQIAIKQTNKDEEVKKGPDEEIKEEEKKDLDEQIPEEVKISEQESKSEPASTEPKSKEDPKQVHSEPKQEPLKEGIIEKSSEKTLDQIYKEDLTRSIIGEGKLSWVQILQCTNQISCIDDTDITLEYGKLTRNLNLAQIRFIWSLVQIFNKYYAKVLRFLNLQMPLQTVPSSALLLSLSAKMNTLKDLTLAQAKSDLRTLVIDRTALQNIPLPVVKFERLNKDDQRKKNGKTAPSTVDSLSQMQFIQAHEQIKNIDMSHLRQKYPGKNLPHISFQVKFKGEDVEGDGGPYRQMFQDICEELQLNKIDRASGSGSAAAKLDLLMPCANQIDEEQIGKDRFVINSAKSQSKDLAMFKFLGNMMGISLRTGTMMVLDFPVLVWKMLSGQQIDIDDLAEIEVNFVRSMRDLLMRKEEEFEYIPMYWQTQLPCGTTVDLTEERVGGDERQVEYAERFDYVVRCFEARLQSIQEQVLAIREGIAMIIPDALINMVSSQNLEAWICGSKSIDLEMLRRHTRYQSAEADYQKEGRLIKMLWQFLQELTPKQLTRFIKFCWGQERLPPTDSAYERQGIRWMIKNPPLNKKQDDLLPEVSTCFFNIQLPNYSSKEIMSKKILLAINTDCISMNAERTNLHDQQNNEDSDGY